MITKAGFRIDELPEAWNDLGQRVRERWPRLTTDDVDGIAGSRDRLVKRIQEQYGLPRDDAAGEESQTQPLSSDENRPPTLHPRGARSSSEWATRGQVSLQTASSLPPGSMKWNRRRVVGDAQTDVGHRAPSLTL